MPRNSGSKQKKAMKFTIFGSRIFLYMYYIYIRYLVRKGSVFVEKMFNVQRSIAVHYDIRWHITNGHLCESGDHKSLC